MENIEKALLERAVEHDSQIRRLYNEHKKLEERLVSYEGRVFLTNKEQIEVKELKKRKLRGKDMLMELLAQFQHGASRLALQ